MMAQGRGVSMPPLRVPERHREGLTAILAAEPDVISALILALGRGTTRGAHGNVSITVTADLPGVPPDTEEKIVNAAVALYSVRAHQDQTASELADDLLEAITSGTIPELSVPDENHDEIRAKLTKLLSVDNLLYAWKSRDVLGDQERQYCTARILTDVRPIFAVASTEDIVTVGVVHTLKITYHEGDDTKDIFMSISDGNIGALREILDRSEKKSKKLRSMIKDMGI